MSLTVRGKRVLVRTEDQSVTERPSGLVLVEAYAPDVVGTVVACGDVQDVALGDVVLFPADAGLPLEYDGLSYLVLAEEELIAVHVENAA